MKSGAGSTSEDHLHDLSRGDWDVLARSVAGFVTALRRGETENCVMCRGESSCILPISAAAVHTIPAGSRLAIRHFTEYLERFPDDLEVRWLLNIAHMTLAEHPDKVDAKYLVKLDHYLKNEFDIGKFRDIGQLVGVNRFNGVERRSSHRYASRMKARTRNSSPAARNQTARSFGCGAGR